MDNNFAPFDLNAPANSLLDNSLFTVQDPEGNTNAYNSTVTHDKNCANLETGDKPLRVHNQTSLVDDSCLQTEKNNQSVEASDYMLTNFRSCDADLVNVLNRATENKGVTVKDGFDVNKNKIDDNTKVRFGTVESRPKCAQQLFTRPYKTVPFMGRGMVDNAEENEIKTGNASQGKNRPVAELASQKNKPVTFLIPHSFCRFHSNALAVRHVFSSK